MQWAARRRWFYHWRTCVPGAAGDRLGALGADVARGTPTYVDTEFAFKYTYMASDTKAIGVSPPEVGGRAAPFPKGGRERLTP